MPIPSIRKPLLTIAIGGISALAIACSSLAAQEIEQELTEPLDEISTAIEQTEPSDESSAIRFNEQTTSFHIKDGRQVLDFDVETYAHGAFRLSDFEGQPVVLNFWYPSCPGCRIEKPFIRAAEEKWKERGVVFIGVQLTAIDSVQTGIEFLSDNGLTYRNFADNGWFARAFDVFGYPSTVFIDTEHRQFDHHRGAITSESTIGAKLIQIFENSGEFGFQ